VKKPRARQATATPQPPAPGAIPKVRTHKK
jgi:hypothetical protein